MKVLVWDDHSYRRNARALAEYPNGIRNCIADFLKSDTIEVSTATLEDEECGLTEEVLRDTDVLIYWAHLDHDKVPDAVVDRIQKHVQGGMGLIILHSAHFSKIFRRMLGTTCSLKWREDVRERLWTILPNHPIAKDVEETFAFDCEEMYGEPFDIPTPEEVVFMGWFSGGEVFRSGCTWTRGNGKIFYFQPGHETNPTFKNNTVQTIIRNAVMWACPIRKNIVIRCPQAEALEN